MHVYSYVWVCNAHIKKIKINGIHQNVSKYLQHKIIKVIIKAMTIEDQGNISKKKTSKKANDKV